jgi:hypothetical protein
MTIVVIIALALIAVLVIAYLIFYVVWWIFLWLTEYDGLYYLTILLASGFIGGVVVLIAWATGYVDLF